MNSVLINNRENPRLNTRTREQRDNPVHDRFRFNDDPIKYKNRPFIEINATEKFETDRMISQRQTQQRI